MGSFISDLFSDFFHVANSDKQDSRGDLLVSGLALIGLGVMIGLVAYWFLGGLWTHIDQPVEDASARGRQMNMRMAFRLAIPGGVAAIISLVMVVYGLLSLAKAVAIRDSSE